MREDLLHFVWRHQKFDSNRLLTTADEPIKIYNQGSANQYSGPDFFNAKIQIADQLWAGNIEIHVKASDWYAHGHESDTNYDNVILHVVWEDDVAIFRKDGSQIPVLELEHYLSEELLNYYRKLFENPKYTFINCEQDFFSTDGFIMDNWLERLFFERLEQKSKLIFELLEASKNDWEKVLFCLLMKNFGLNINGPVFLEIAQALDFSIIRKTRHNLLQIESLLFGMAGLLQNETILEAYFLGLVQEFEFLRHKHQLSPIIQKPEFSGLRPHNFPTIRLAQIANLYHKNQNLFSSVLATGEPSDFYSLFSTNVSAYWKHHFTFGKSSKTSQKKLTENFIDLLLINTIIPLKFSYAKYLGKEMDDHLVVLLAKIKAEKNTIIGKYDTIGPRTKNALQSQAKIQLYQHYCNKNQCLRCAIGADLLNRNS